MTIFTIIIAGSNPGGNGGNGGGGGGGGGGGNPETGDDSYIYNGEGIGQQPTEGYDGKHIVFEPYFVSRSFENVYSLPFLRYFQQGWCLIDNIVQ